MQFEPGVVIAGVDPADHCGFDQFAEIPVGGALGEDLTRTDVAIEDLRQGERATGTSQDLDHGVPGTAVAHPTNAKATTDHHVQVVDHVTMGAITGVLGSIGGTGGRIWHVGDHMPRIIVGNRWEHPTDEMTSLRSCD